MLKRIKKWGSSAVITISPEELELYGLQIGDVIDISDLVKVKEIKNEKE